MSAIERKFRVYPGTSTANVVVNEVPVLSEKDRIIAERNKRFEKTDAEFMNKVYDLLREGKALDNDNFADWIASVEKIKQDLPMPKE